MVNVPRRTMSLFFFKAFVRFTMSFKGGGLVCESLFILGAEGQDHCLIVFRSCGDCSASLLQWFVERGLNKIKRFLL
jgi:hypothetical protein